MFDNLQTKMLPYNSVISIKVLIKQQSMKYSQHILITSGSF